MVAILNITVPMMPLGVSHRNLVFKTAYVAGLFEV